MAARERVRVEFWLDLNKDGEAALAEDIAELKGDRAFAPTLRDGLRLVGDLRQGRLDELHRLFPWVIDRIYSDVEARLLADGRGGAGAGTLALSGPVPRLGEGSRGEDDLGDLLEEREVQEDATNRAGWNLLIASAQQIAGSYDGLPPEVLDYGLATGRIPKSAVPERKAAEEETRSSGPKAMDVPQFDAPDLDRDEFMDMEL